jgi:hypothetical protein
VSGAEVPSADNREPKLLWSRHAVSVVVTAAPTPYSADRVW